MLHDQFDVLALQTLLVDLLTIILFLFILVVVVMAFMVVVVLDGLSFAVVVASVRVLASNDLLSSGSLSLGVEILDLSLAEDAKGMSAEFMLQLRA